MLPEAVCLTDYGLGHDNRATHPQPVRSRMGERFLPWQLEQSVKESWAECEQHARNILGEERFERLMEELNADCGFRISDRRTAESDASPASSESAEEPPRPRPTDLFGKPVPVDLFSQPVTAKRKRRR